ncbi:MAG: class I SAM-dependent methyltransferase [Verrucomicrobia bacterium]|nr:class I SAM-dependent methyltransferase [Verrucomicrobiota bacterium]
MSFDRLAPHYTWMERALAGPRLQRCRTTWLEELAGCRRLLIAGVGHGHFLAACARRFPTAEITSVDASAPMLAAARVRARRSAPNFSRLEFIHASLPAWQPPAAQFDAIATHFFLDCFAPEELARVVLTLARAARPSAKWLLSDFAVPEERGWARQRARAIHATMYAFFRPIAGVQARRVTPPDELLRGQGFALARRQTSEWGLLHADLWTRG